MNLRNKQKTPLMNPDAGVKGKIVLGIGGSAALIAVIMVFKFIGIQTIEGNERAVVQHWSDGVRADLWQPGTTFYNGLTTTPYVYHIGAQRFIMGLGEGSDVPPFKVTTGGEGNEQPATFHATLQYSLDTSKLVALHNKCNTRCEASVIKNTLTRLISDQATQLKVLDFYSGAGRTKLQDSIEKAITEHPALVSIGINVENFVFDRIVLDQNYVQKIAARQLAHQDKLKNIEETKAAEEAAKKTEALAEADKLKRIVNAEAAKQEEIKKAEANNESRILAAKANAAEIKEKAAADRFRKEQDAKGLLAQGIAEAKVAEAKRNSKYNGVSGLRQAQVEIAKARVGLFQNMAIKGVLDKDVALTIINSTGSNTPALTVPASASK
jgi:regulator of protease activity HflC (stomatin/prohibitin superfamily)